MRGIHIVCCAMKADVVATGVPFGEGPVWCPDGTLVVTSVAEGALYLYGPERDAPNDLPTLTAGPTAPHSRPTAASW